jgi:ATP-dependent Clp protease adapter protein ClpS
MRQVHRTGTGIVIVTDRQLCVHTATGRHNKAEEGRQELSIYIQKQQEVNTGRACVWCSTR